MTSALSGLREGIWALAKQKQDRNANQLDQATKYAQLAESGYRVKQQPSGRMFGGSQMVLEQDPGFQSLKTLQRQKMVNELDPNYSANQAAAKEEALINVRKKAYGFGSGASQPSGDSQQQFVMSPDGRLRQNPDYLDPLKKAKLDQLQKKQQEAQQAEDNKNEMLRSNAEDMLNTVGEVKKGMKYFGAMGNAPTLLTPSAYTGEYGQRKNWESNVNKLLSGKIIDLMTQMKNASKTGATGFGALSQKELAVLQEASTALNRGLSPDDASRYLNQIETMQRKALGKFGSGAKAKSKSGGQIMTDANGNRAMVYPDGSYEEL